MPTPEANLEAQRNFLKREFPNLVGKKIATVRPLGIRERTDYGWDADCEELAYAFILDDGTALVPVKDVKGSEPAVIFAEKTEWVPVDDAKLPVPPRVKKAKKTKKSTKGGQPNNVLHGPPAPVTTIGQAILALGVGTSVPD